VAWLQMCDVLSNVHSPACTACRGDDFLVEEVRKAVLRMRVSVQHSEEQLVGLEPQLQTIRAALAPGQGVQLHGLYGLGGIGKSTLAQRFFQEARSQFSRHAFVQVGQQAALPDKQRELLQQIGGVAAAGSGDAQLCSALRESFKSGPLLLVLDDLWAAQQLAALLGCEQDSQFQLPADLLASGSRLLITARSKAVVSGRIAGAAAPQQVQLLPELAARQLLCLHAFEQGVQPLTFGEQQMAAATAICGCLPLTLRLLGGALKHCTTSVGWQVIMNWLHPHSLHVLGTSNGWQQTAVPISLAMPLFVCVCRLSSMTGRQHVASKTISHCWPKATQRCRAMRTAACSWMQQCCCTSSPHSI
jgi:NB-ARC domain